MQRPFPVENSVDSVENLRISPAFSGFFPFVPFCNYWIKLCIMHESMQEIICYGNVPWKGIPRGFLRKSWTFRESTRFFPGNAILWKLFFVKTIQKSFWVSFPPKWKYCS